MSRKSQPPIIALFGALSLPASHGMKLLADRGGILSDLWELYPEPEEISTAETIKCFELAKTRLNPAWCERWISHLKSF